MGKEKCCICGLQSLILCGFKLICTQLQPTLASDYDDYLSDACLSIIASDFSPPGQILSIVLAMGKEKHNGKVEDCKNPQDLNILLGSF